ncbi:hypothetical protein WA538_000318 [Blastocystis sp. DL]
MMTMKKMKDNVDSRGDKEEAVIERAAFATIALHCGSTEESLPYCKELVSMCKGLNTPAALSANLLSTLQQHLSGEEKMYDACLKLRDPASSQGKFWELLVLNNALGMMWDDDAPTAPAESLCSDIKKVSEQMDAAGEIKKANSDAVRQCLNNAGAYLLFREKKEEGGAILKYALQLSDRDGININENITSSNTLGMMGSILLKEDQPVTCEGLYLQALEVFDKKKTMTRPELFDYSKACDGYSQLLVKWDKRERLGEQYQQKASELLMKMSENADWMFPLTSRFWTPTLFKWDFAYCCVCW